MPDRDIFSRYAAPGWRAPMKCFYVSAEPDEVARAAWRATAQTLRRHGGLAPLAALAAIVRDHDNGDATARQSMERVRALEGEHGYDLHVRIAALTASRMVAEGHAGGGAFPEPERSLAARFIQDLMSHHVFERGRPELMAQRFGQDEALRAGFEERCWAAICANGKLEKVAEQLVRDPSGALVRAPTSPSAQRMTTGDWLAHTVV